MKNNPVFQVLVTDTNLAFLGAGLLVENLAVGQLGLFNAETNLSVAITDTTVLPAKFFFAVGVANAAGTLGDVRLSAGQVITKSLINSVVTQEIVTAENQVTTIDFDGLTFAAGGKEVIIRMSFMNAATMDMQGFNHPAVSIVVPITGALNANEFVDLVVAEINANKQDDLFVAANVGDEVQITFGAEAKVTTLAGLNPKYHYLRPVKATVSVGGDILPIDWIITTTGPVYEEGSGYDIVQEEYIAGGWNGKPGIFRDSNVTGLIGHATEILAKPTSKYFTTRLNYEIASHSGGNLEYKNEAETLIAIPQEAADLDVINDIATMFSFNGFSGSKDITTTTTTA
jgi:hypothetical protein